MKFTFVWSGPEMCFYAFFFIAGLAGFGEVVSKTFIALVRKWQGRGIQ